MCVCVVGGQSPGAWEGLVIFSHSSLWDNRVDIGPLTCCRLQRDSLLAPAAGALWPVAQEKTAHDNFHPGTWPVADVGAGLAGSREAPGMLVQVPVLLRPEVSNESQGNKGGRQPPRKWMCVVRAFASGYRLHTTRGPMPPSKTGQSPVAELMTGK